MKKKKMRWHRARHNFWWHVMRSIMRVYCKIKYRLSLEKFDNSKRPYLVLFNHPTPIDPLMTCLALKKYAYIVCTEDLFTMGSTTKFIRHAVAPIPFKKSMADAGAVMNCMRVAREGYSIVLSPEGSRTFSGKTCHIKPAIAKLIKSLKMPVAVYMFDGGYVTHPRFADKPRKGTKVKGRVAAVLEPEEFKDMSADEVYSWLVDKMSFDESDAGVEIKNDKRAEYMQRAVYFCPVCKKAGGIYGKGNKVSCSLCGAGAEVDTKGRFSEPFPVRTLGEWIDVQDKWVGSLEADDFIDTPLSVDGGVLFRQFLTKQFKKKELLKDAEVRLYTDRLEIGADYVFPFDGVTAVAPCGRNRVDFYVGDITYQLSSKSPLSIMKYVNIFYNYKNKKENKEDGILGI